MMLPARFTVMMLASLLLIPCTTNAKETKIEVVTDSSGQRLQVNGQDFLIKGMNWDYVPIGQNYAYSLWNQPDPVIEAALDREMSLLKSMGVNTIRQYVGIPERWVRYIHERWGMWIILNHTVARYGYTLDGVWMPSVNYSDPRLRAAVKSEVLALVNEFRNTPGVLMWLLGNENNYGLSWTSFEIEALPKGERDAARAKHLYSLMGEIAREVKELDRSRPVAIANGDLQYIDLIAQECSALDILGTNVYRGVSARDLYEVVKEKLGRPVLFTEFGCDAWNAKAGCEDQEMQCRYLMGQWQEIYEQTAGKGRTGNCIGGTTFQWSDGWWKFGQESRLDIHDTNASWPNGGYAEDYSPGDNNMNEEWWGITAKGQPDWRGLYELYPRAAYYALQEAYTLDPFAPETNLETIRAHFASIDLADARLRARADAASHGGETLRLARVKGMRLEFETFSTGGKRVTTPKVAEAGSLAQPAFRGFDQLQSYYIDLEANASPNVTGTLSFNVLGHVPENAIDEIFYENRGRPRVVVSDPDSLRLQGIERIKVYRANVSWDDRWFALDGFYRAGHYHWGYEGDFFGLYQEANYGENIDTYNGDAPLGVEVRGKKFFSGSSLAFGPELWWGANPSVLAKFGRRAGPVDLTAVYQEDISSQASVTSSIAVPRPKTRKATLHGFTRRGPISLDVGGIWSGSTKVGDTFDLVEGEGDETRVLRDEVRTADAFGAKAKVAVQSGPWNWYAQSAYMGLVADGGPTAVTTYTGWELKDSGSGNQTNIVSGLAYNLGKFQIAPNVLWQKPLVGPVPADAPAPGRPRNILDDPFAVRSNREALGAELLFVYDPTPATWMWAWDNNLREDAALAASVGLVYRDFKTTQDAAVGILADGRTTFAFPGAPPARDLWEIHGRVVSRLGKNLRALTHFFAGTGEPNGEDARVVRRAGGDARIVWNNAVLETFAKFNDWGPYDYHRDFNLTFPAQAMADLSYTLGKPQWLGLPQTRFGVRGNWRSLDQNSPRYAPAFIEDSFGVLIVDPEAAGERGQEWEIRTYLHFVL